MSLADLILDERKTWLVGRMEQLTLDGALIADGGIELGPTGAEHLTISFTGPRSITADADAQRIADQVFLNIWSESGSASATGTFVSSAAIPERFRPTDTATFYGEVVNNSVQIQGSVAVGLNGIITIGVNEISSNHIKTGQPFTSSGNCGWVSLQGSYSVGF